MFPPEKTRCLLPPLLNRKQSLYLMAQSDRTIRILPCSFLLAACVFFSADEAYYLSLVRFSAVNLQPPRSYLRSRKILNIQSNLEVEFLRSIAEGNSRSFSILHDLQDLMHANAKLAEVDSVDRLTQQCRSSPNIP